MVFGVCTIMLTKENNQYINYGVLDSITKSIVS